MRKFIFGIFMMITVFSSFLLLSPSTVQAAGVADRCDKSSAFLGFPQWFKYLDVGQKEGDPCGIQGPLDADQNLDWEKAAPRIGLAVVEMLLRIAGLVGVGFTIFGGFKYMTSQGEPENLKQAQATIINALVGLVIAILATSIIGFIGGRIWN